MWEGEDGKYMSDWTYTSEMVVKKFFHCYSSSQWLQLLFFLQFLVSSSLCPSSELIKYDDIHTSMCFDIIFDVGW